MENRYVVGMPDAEYRALPGINQSMIARFIASRTPYHFKRELEIEDDETTPAMRFGQALDCQMLTPELFAESFEVRDRKRGESKVPNVITPAEHKIILSVIDEMNRDCPDFLEGDKQAVFYVQDPKTGIWLKGKLDICNTKRHLIRDLKFLHDASFRGFQKAMEERMYYIQAAHYRRMYKIVFGIVPKVEFGIRENTFPHAMARYELEQECLDWGELQFDLALAKIKECEAFGNWPSYPKEVQKMGFSPWYKPKEI